MEQIGNPAVADTVAAVFRSKPFAQHGMVSIGQLFLQWVLATIERILEFAARHPAIGAVLRVAVGIAVLALLARIAYAVFLRYSPSIAPSRTADTVRNRDWWASSQQLAATGDYTGAAHALYLALITAAARRGSVSLHESKTTGDYLREVRRRPADIDVRRFTDFTRSYETVIYGVGTCDRDRYTTLSTLALSILGAAHARNAT